MGRICRTLAVIAVMVGTTIPGVSPAHAKVAGTNGQLVFARYDPAIDDSHVFTINPDGRTSSRSSTASQRSPIGLLMARRSR